MFTVSISLTFKTKYKACDGNTQTLRDCLRLLQTFVIVVSWYKSQQTSFHKPHIRLVYASVAVLYCSHTFSPETKLPCRGKSRCYVVVHLLRNRSVKALHNFTTVLSKVSVALWYPSGCWRFHYNIEVTCSKTLSRKFFRRNTKLLLCFKSLRHLRCEIIDSILPWYCCFGLLRTWPVMNRPVSNGHPSEYIPYVQHLLKIILRPTGSLDKQTCPSTGKK